MLRLKEDCLHHKGAVNLEFWLLHPLNFQIKSKLHLTVTVSQDRCRPALCYVWVCSDLMPNICSMDFSACAHQSFLTIPTLGTVQHLVGLQLDHTCAARVGTQQSQRRKYSSSRTGGWGSGTCGDCTPA